MTHRDRRTLIQRVYVGKKQQQQRKKNKTKNVKINNDFRSSLLKDLPTQSIKSHQIHHTERVFNMPIAQ